METETKKKVLLFIPEFPTLTETFIEREVSKLAESPAYDVHVVSLKRGKGKLSDNLTSRVTYSKMEIADLPGVLLFFLWNLVKDPNKLKELYEYMFGSEFDIKNLWLLIRSIGYYYPLFQSFNPSIIYAHFLSEPSTVALIVAKFEDLPLGISAHAKDIFVAAEYVEQKITYAKFITICNKRAYDYCVALGEKAGLDKDLISQKIHLIYHGADFSKLESINPSGATRGHNARPKILSVGRLVEKKGYKYLIEASKILKEKNIPHEVTIIGPGPLQKDLEDQISSLGLEHTVKLIGVDGNMTFEDTVSHYRNADIFVFPGIQTDSGDSDGIANVLIEAAVYKLPIICTDAGSAQDLVQNGETGLVVSQKDASALSNALIELLNSPEKRNSLGNAAYLGSKKKFDLNSNIIHIEEMLGK